MSKTRVRLIDVAKRAKVSRAAVARVLLGTGAGRIGVGKEKTALIKKIAEEMNFQPDNSAQMLAGKNSKIIGVLIDSYAPQVRFKTLSVAEEILAKEGFRLMIGQTHNNYDNFKSYIADFASRRVDAIICFAHDYPNFDISKDFEGFKNVVFVGKPKLENTNFVEVDIKRGIEKLVKHLAENGRKKIGLWGSSSGETSSSLRESGYIQSIKKHMMNYNADLISYSFNYVSSQADCLNVINHLVKDQNVDAIIAKNDLWAIKLIKSLRKNGYRVPEDIAVTGFDNIDISGLFEPELTTIETKSEEQGRIIAEMILKMINNKKEVVPWRFVIEPELVVRESA